MLLHEPVEIFAFLLMLLVFQCGFGLDRRIGQTIQIAQFEAPGAIHIILQGGLRKRAELEGSHFYMCIDYSIYRLQIVFIEIS